MYFVCTTVYDVMANKTDGQEVKVKTTSIRISETAHAHLIQIAGKFSCVYGDSPNVSGLMEEIGQGRLFVSNIPPSKGIKEAQQEVIDLKKQIAELIQT
jgi:hypothetical protein